MVSIFFRLTAIARSVREESISSPDQTRTAIHVDCATSAPVGQSIHRILNETVDGHGFRKKYRPSASPGSACVDRVRLEHPNKVNHAQGLSNHSMHAEEVHGENQSGHVISSSIAEQEL